MATGFKSATVNASDVPSTQTNFPAYVDLSRLGITTTSEAESVRVYSDAGKTTELAREIVSVNEMWVKIPSLTSSFTIYVDWDDTSADYAVTDTYGRNAVWSEYYLVFHGDSLTDSTGNYSMSATGASVGTGTGQIEEATVFDGSNDYVESSSFLLEYPYSLQVWANPDSSSTTGIYGARYTGSAATRMFQFFQAGGHVYARAFHSGGFYGRYINNGAATGYNMFHATYESTITGSSDIKIYKNGVQADDTDTNSGTGTINESTDTIRLGEQQTGSADYAGDLDEFRCYNGTLTVNWITTEYNNQSDESTFWGTWSDAGSSNQVKSVAGISNV